MAAEFGRIRFAGVEFDQVGTVDIAVLGKSRPADPSLSAIYDRN